MNGKKLIMKAISVALSILLIVQVIPLTIFAAESSTAPAAEEQAEEVYVVGEIESQRTESTKHFLMSDGTYVAATYTER